MEKQDIDIAAMLKTAIKVITAPVSFFREMPKTGGFVQPLVFMMLMGLIAGVVQAILATLGFCFTTGIGMTLVSIILYPIVVGILGFVGAGIVFVIWKLMGSQEPYETAYRCTAYIAALWPITTVFNLIPYIGILLAVGLMVYFAVIASVEVHKIAAQTAWIVFGILGAILVLMGISSKMAARSFRGDAIEFQKQMEKSAAEIQKSTEAAKKALEEMQKNVGNK